MTDLTSTQALVERFHAGDRSALNELYGRYLPRVLMAMRARLGRELRRKLDSSDVLQDAMLASLKNIDSFEHASEGAFLNWLCKVVENRIRDQVDFHRAGRRDHRREKPLADGRSDDSGVPLDLPGPSDLPSPSQVLMLNEDLARLEMAMDRLPEEARELIIAVRIEGRSYDELGRCLGKSPDAVRMQVNRAVIALTKAFQELNAGQ